ncbi:MAG: rhomboid family intramembrane serine protease [Candidatus Brocadiia bacterium]
MESGVMQQSPVALFILVLTIVTSLIAWQYPDLFRFFALSPWSLVRERRYYTFLTSGLIHADVGHLIFNMFSFYFFAFLLEQLMGHWQFFVLYAASLVLSDITTVVKHRDDPDYFCVGASGAVTAVIFSFILYAPKDTILIFGVIPMPAWLFGIVFVAYSYYSARFRQTRVNHAAHLWGAVSGLALTLILAPAACKSFLQAMHLIS